jgi:integrase
VTSAAPGPVRTPARRKARQLARYLRSERPDYAYLKEVFRHLREELGVEVTRTPKKLPYVPTEGEISAFYRAVWKARRAGDVVLIKTLLYTGVRVAELVRIRLADVDLDACRIRINQGKGSKDRVVPFPAAFKETLALHIAAQAASARRTCSSRAGKSPTATAASARSSPSTPRPSASPRRSARTSSATSCSPGSRPRASTTP